MIRQEILLLIISVDLFQELMIGIYIVHATTAQLQGVAVKQFI